MQNASASATAGSVASERMRVRMATMDIGRSSSGNAGSQPLSAIPSEECPIDVRTRSLPTPAYPRLIGARLASATREPRMLRLRHERRDGEDPEG